MINKRYRNRILVVKVIVRKIVFVIFVVLVAKQPVLTVLKHFA